MANENGLTDHVFIFCPIAADAGHKCISPFASRTPPANPPDTVYANVYVETTPAIDTFCPTDPEEPAGIK
jgi:hypothetical protein